MGIGVYFPLVGQWEEKTTNPLHVSGTWLSMLETY